MAQPADVLRIGTRGSPLALVQARAVRAGLARALARDPETIALTVIRTTGDRVQDRPLAEEGGKGLFAKEIEEALLAGTIELAVHSAKDLPTILPEGLQVTACLPREDARDVLISHEGKTLATLPKGARVGSTSPRRIALVKRARPDVAIVPMRGNVETRLRKLEEGAADATILALAGLKRLGLEGKATTIMSADEFLPAAGQGTIAIETRANDATINMMMKTIDDADTSTALAAERAFLGELEGTCYTPIAAHAVVSGNAVQFRGLIVRPNGTSPHDIAATGERSRAAQIAAECGRTLRQRAGPGFFD